MTIINYSRKVSKSIRCYSNHLWSTIALYYLGSWFYKMPPHYRNIHVMALGDTFISALGIRGIPGLSWIPYFSGTEIGLYWGIKLHKKALNIDRLPYSWRLKMVDSDKPEFSGNGELIISDDNKVLISLLFLPYLVGIGKEYVLEIQIVYKDMVLREWDKIFDFELHSGDKMLFGIVIPIITFVVGMLLLFTIQKLFGIKL